MSDMNSKDKFEKEQNMEVQLYRQKKAEQFKLNISDDAPAKSDTQVFSRNEGKAAHKKSDASNEITSFSNETTRAQIEKASKKALRAEKKEAKKVKKIKSGRNKKIYRIAWLLLILILSAVTAEFLVTGVNDLFAVNRESEEIVTVIIAKDDSVDDISKKLQGKGVINSSTFFSMFLGITGKGDDIEPGVYEIATNKDYLGVVNFMRNVDNRLTTITLQFKEGLTILEVADKLYDSGVTADKDAFLRLCNSDDFDKEYGFLGDIEPDEDRIYKLEGYLFPDTYEFYVDEDPKLTISRFLDNFAIKINETKVTAPGYSETMTIAELAKRGEMSIDDIVNTAALVQGESADTEDMYNVSSVISNRLKYGAQQDIHSLGMDSSQFYPYHTIDDVPEDMRDTFVSAYETYDSEGLPPGPICSPGLDALTAAVSPNNTNYFYFCHGQNADGTVTSYYAETLMQHQANLVAAGLS